MLPGDRLVCAFLDSLDAGSIFHEWPLHITIVPWFRLDETSTSLVESLKTLLSDQQKFTYRVGGTAHFGGKRRVLVHLVNTPTPLERIQHTVREYLRGHNAWFVDESTGDRWSYRPHITVQGEVQAHEGTIHECNALYIVEQNGTHKQVVGKVGFAE